MKTVVVVSGILTHKGSVLVLQGSKDNVDFPGIWELPGGKVKFGENPNDAIVREIKEETGIESKVIAPYNVWSTKYVHNEEEHHVIHVDFLMGILTEFSLMKLSEEHQNYKWVELHDLPEPMPPEYRDSIVKAFDYLKTIKI